MPYIGQIICIQTYQKKSRNSNMKYLILYPDSFICQINGYKQKYSHTAIQIKISGQVRRLNRCKMLTQKFKKITIKFYTGRKRTFCRLTCHECRSRRNQHDSPKAAGNQRIPCKLKTSAYLFFHRNMSHTDNLHQKINA